MRTLLFRRKDIPKAAILIKEGKLVAFPTETVYGLGANALDEKAIEKIYKAKRRPVDNPLIVHVSSPRDVKNLAKNISPKAKKLMKEFWPGPCSIVFKKKLIIPKITTAGLDTVVIRMPKNSLALELIKQAGVPIAAPSANSSGKPSPTTAKHVLEDLNGRIEAIIDGGQCKEGLESTVIDVHTKIPTILRVGSLSVEEIEKSIGSVKIATSKTKVVSPGMKYRHYAPSAKLILVEGDRDRVDKKIRELTKKYKSITILKRQDLVPKQLFAILRRIDTKVVICPGINEKNKGRAVMDRLRRAASKRIILSS